MEPAAPYTGRLADASKHLAWRLFTTGENRLELWKVEMQEARGSLLQAILLGAGMIACAAFAVLALNVAIVVLFWNVAPVAVLLLLGALHAFGAAAFYWQLIRQLREWTPFNATLDQLRKDCTCLATKLT